MSKYCERFGRKLWYKQITAKTYNTDTGEEIIKGMDGWFCWFGKVFGRGNPYCVQHSDYVTGDWAKL